MWKWVSIILMPNSFHIKVKTFGKDHKTEGAINGAPGHRTCGDDEMIIRA